MEVVVRGRHGLIPLAMAVGGAALALVVNACGGVRFNRTPWIGGPPPSSSADVRVCPMLVGIAENFIELPSVAAMPPPGRLTGLSAFLVRAHGVFFLVEAGVLPHASMPPHVRLVESLFGYDKHEGTRVVSQLRDAGVLGRLSFIVVTHSHGDHAGDLEGLNNLPILISPEELSFLEGMSAPVLGNLSWRSPSAWVALRERLRAIRWADIPVGPFPRSSDLFGDGSVVFVPTPGHTPGSISVVMPRANGRGAMLLGDAALTGVGLRNRVPRGWFESVLDWDPPLFRRTFSTLHSFTADRPDWELYPSHDAAIAKMRYDFYECARQMMRP